MKREEKIVIWVAASIPNVDSAVNSIVSINSICETNPWQVVRKTSH
jgi:hypothetical protein